MYNYKNKKVAKFRYKPLKHWKKLEQLFEGTFSTGEDAYNQIIANDNDVKHEVPFDVDNNAHIHMECYVPIPLDGDARVGPKKDDYSSTNNISSTHNISSAKNITSQSAQSFGKRKRAIGEFSDIVKMIQGHIETFRTDRELLRKNIEEDREGAKACSIEECVRLLDALLDIPELGLDEDLISTATIKFCERIDYRRAFMMQTTIEKKAAFV